MKEEQEKAVFRLLLKFEEANLAFLGSCSTFHLQIGFLNGFLKEHQMEEEESCKFMFSTLCCFG